MRSKAKQEIESVCRLIPGYDPWALAESCGAWFDHARAERAVRFFPNELQHVEGALAGQPFRLEVWQQAIVGNLFGWLMEDEAGRTVRRYREVFLYVPRKNGKTPLAAGLCLLMLFADQEPGAQIYGAAADSEQAALLYRHARGMVERNPKLRAASTIYGGDNHRSIVLRADPGSVYRVISSEAASKHGVNPHMILMDELHAQDTRELYDALVTSMASKNRRQPLLVEISTADYDRPSVCNEVLARMRSVRDNGGDASKPGYDGRVLPVIYEAGQDADWQDEELWRRVNPNLGVSLSLDFLRAECRRAKENPAYENTFRRLYLNQVVKQDVRIVPMEAFDACAGPIELAEFVGRRCYGGLDLASTKDLASFCLAFPGESEAEPVTVVVWAWCPQARVTQRDERGVPYQAWAREGHLFATSGNEIDYGVIEQHIKACANKYDVREIGFDGWNAAQITQNLMAAGLAMVKVPASLDQLSAPTKELLRRIRAGTLRHNGNPVLRWAASNVAAYYRGVVRYAADVDELLDKVPIMFSKQKSADKIDPMAAIVLAFNRMIAHPDEQAGESVYESRGMAFV